MESELAEEAKEREEYEARDKSRIKFRSDYTATFGTYNSKSIEWIVLDRQDDKVLLVTRDIIDSSAYDYSEKDVTWEKCQMRQWLNNSFYNEAFGSSEKGLILKTDVVNGYNAEYKTNGGNDTQDKVFHISQMTVQGRQQAQKTLKTEAFTSMRTAIVSGGSEPRVQ